MRDSMFLVKRNSFAQTSSNLAESSANSFGGNNLRSCDNCNNTSTSFAEAKEIFRKWTNSFGLALQLPSAMLRGMETAARRICEVMFCSSCLGKFFCCLI